MKAKIQTLARLQACEDRIHQLEEDLCRAPERYAALNAERQAMEGALAAVEAQLDELNQRYRALDREARQQQDRAKKRAARLHEIKTNKEYQAILKEIEDIRAGTSAIEDEMIGLLDAIEAAEAARTEQREIQARREAVLLREVAEIEQTMALDREHLAAAKQAREVVAAQVDDALMATYLHARSQQKNGVAVAGVRQAVCQGCHMNIPPQLYNELQRQDSLKICPLCQRIIFWLNEEA